MILYPIIAFVSIFVLVAAVRVVPGQIAHHRHERALARIAVLERELGIGQPIEPLTAVEMWNVTEKLRHRPAVKRVYGDCALCGRRVTLNEGDCQVSSASKCAKLEYWRSRV